MPDGIAKYIQDHDYLMVAISTEIDERNLSDSEYLQRYGTSRDEIFDFFFTDEGPDRVWSAMTRKQQIAALEDSDLPELIAEFAKPETAQDVLEREIAEQEKKYRRFLFRVKSLQGFTNRTPEFVHIFTNPEADVCISDSASPDSGKSLGVKMSNIVAAEIVTPGVVARRDEYIAQAASADKLKNAAAGAVLGFLLAGPLGTAVGGMYGAGSGSGGGRGVRAAQYDSDGVGLIGFEDGSGIIVTMSKHTAPDFDNLKSAVTQMSAQRNQAAAAAEYKECPMCAEDVKAKAKICRFCGHTFS